MQRLTEHGRSKFFSETCSELPGIAGVSAGSPAGLAGLGVVLIVTETTVPVSATPGNLRSSLALRRPKRPVGPLVRSPVKSGR